MSIKWLMWLHRKGIKRSALHGTWLHKIFGNSLFAKDLWCFTKSSVSRGWVIGCFAASNPFLGLQIAMGLPFALLFRANLWVMIALIFATNPITIGPFLVFCYMIGAWLTGNYANISEDQMVNATFTEVFKAGFSRSGFFSMMLGCLVVAVVSALVGYIFIQIFWKDKRKT